jgi:plasmid stabilization system protein ParE
VNAKPVVALFEVEADLEFAKACYASWQTDGAARLLEKYDETVGAIELTPDACPRKQGAIQRAILRRSFYLVYFIPETDRSVILAVLDGRRSPREIRRLVGFRRLLTRPSADK